MARTMLVILNPLAASGRGASRCAAALAALRATGTPYDFVETAATGHAIALAREAAGRYDTVVAAGGDGTVNEVASGVLLSGAACALGILPVGTGNDVATLLGLTPLEASVWALAGTDTRSVDAIEVNGHEAGRPARRYALLYAAAGFIGDLLRHTTPRVKRIFGPRYAYSVGFFRALFSYRAPRMCVTWDGGTHDGPLFVAAAGNAEYAGGGMMRMSPGALMDDGLLNTSLIEEFSRWEAVRHFPKLLSGTHIDHPKVRYVPTTRLTIETDRPVPLQLDGDLFAETPAEFLVRPGALRVLGSIKP